MRIHVATIHCEEWLELPYLNHKSDEFKTLLEELGCDVWEASNEDGSHVEFEVDKEQFDAALEKLNLWGALDAEERANIQEAIDRCEFTKEDAIKCMTMCQDAMVDTQSMSKQMASIVHRLKGQGALTSNEEKFLLSVRDTLNEFGTLVYHFKFS